MKIFFLSILKSKNDQIVLGQKIDDNLLIKFFDFNFQSKIVITFLEFQYYQGSFVRNSQYQQLCNQEALIEAGLDNLSNPIQCKIGYQAYPNLHKCLKIQNDQNCEHDLISENQKCYKCKIGYGNINNSKCQKCAQNCLKCTGPLPQNCIQCNYNFSIINQFCNLCDQNKQIYDTTTNTCQNYIQHSLEINNNKESIGEIKLVQIKNNIEIQIKPTFKFIFDSYWLTDINNEYFLQRDFQNIPLHKKVILSMDVMIFDITNFEQLGIFIDEQQIKMITFLPNIEYKDKFDQSKIKKIAITTIHQQPQMQLKIKSFFTDKNTNFWIRNLQVDFLGCYQNCENCQIENSPFHCLSCKQGYFLQNNQCLDCQYPCKSCVNNSNTCLSCLENKLLQNNKCVDKCDVNYQLKNDECIQNTKYQRTVRTQNQDTNIDILQCEDGLYLNEDNICVPCIDPCKTCQNQTYCNSCLNDKILFNNECVQKCPEDYNNQQGICCQSNCLTCNQSDQCTSCIQDYYLQDSQCIQCDSTCKECDQKTGHCLSCNENLKLSNGKCYEGCPEYGYYLKGEDCISCQNNCTKCIYIQDEFECQNCPVGFVLLDNQCKKCVDENSPFILINGYCQDKCGDGKRFNSWDVPNLALYNECDDGNTIDGDGCSSKCLVEDGYQCQGGGPQSKDICKNIVPAIASITKKNNELFLINFTKNVKIVDRINIHQSIDILIPELIKNEQYKYQLTPNDEPFFDELKIDIQYFTSFNNYDIYFNFTRQYIRDEQDNKLKTSELQDIVSYWLPDRFILERAVNATSYFINEGYEFLTISSFCLGSYISQIGLFTFFDIYRLKLYLYLNIFINSDFVYLLYDTNYNNVQIFQQQGRRLLSIGQQQDNASIEKIDQYLQTNNNQMQNFIFDQEFLLFLFFSIIFCVLRTFQIQKMSKFTNNILRYFSYVFQRIFFMLLLLNFNNLFYKIFMNFYYAKFDTMQNIMILSFSVFTFFLQILFSIYNYQFLSQDLVEFYHPNIYLTKGILYTAFKLDKNLTRKFFMIYMLRNILFQILLVILKELQMFQILSLTTLNFFYLVSLIKYRPFNNKLQNINFILGESIELSIMLFLIMVNSESKQNNDELFKFYSVLLCFLFYMLILYKIITFFMIICMKLIYWFKIKLNIKPKKIRPIKQNIKIKLNDSSIELSKEESREISSFKKDQQKLSQTNITKAINLEEQIIQRKFLNYNQKMKQTVFFILMIFIQRSQQTCSACDLVSVGKDSMAYHKTSTLAFYYDILQEIVKNLTIGFFDQAIQKAKKQVNNKPQVEITKHGSKQITTYNLLVNNFKVEVVYKDFKIEVNDKKKGKMIVDDTNLTDKVQFPPDLNENGQYSTTNIGIFGYKPEYKQYESHLPLSFFDNLNNFQLPLDAQKELLDSMRIQRNYTIGRPEDFLQKTLEELAAAHPRLFDLAYYFSLFLYTEKQNSAYQYFFNVYEYESLDMYFTGWDKEKANTTSDPGATVFVTRLLRCYYNYFVPSNNKSVQECLQEYDGGAWISKISFQFPPYEQMNSFFKGIINYGVNFMRVFYFQFAAFLDDCNMIGMGNSDFNPWASLATKINKSVNQQSTIKRTATNKTTTTTVKKTVTTTTTVKKATTVKKTKNRKLNLETTDEKNEEIKDRLLPKGFSIQRLTSELNEFLEKFYVKEKKQDDEDGEDQNQEPTQEEIQDAFYRLFKECFQIKNNKGFGDFSLEQGYSYLPASSTSSPGKNPDYLNSQLNIKTKEKDGTLKSYDNTPQFFRVTIGLQPFDDPEIDPVELQKLNKVIQQIDKSYFTVGFSFLRAVSGNDYRVRIHGNGVLSDGTPCLEQIRAQTLNKRMKKLEMREICQRVVEILNGCVNKYLSVMGRKFEHSSIGNTGSDNFCPGKSLLESKTKFVPFLSSPPPQPPQIFIFDCSTYWGWLSEMMNDETAKSDSIQIIQGFEQTYSSKGIVFDMDDFIEIFKILSFYCIDTDDKFYKIIAPYISIYNRYAYKWSRGYIKYKGRMILIINFYIIYDAPQGEDPNNPQYTQDNTELCFEIEKTLTSKTETYIDCYKYPDIQPPGSAGSQIPHEYYFTLYLKVLRKHYYYIKKMKLIIDHQITIYDIYNGIINFLKIKLGNDILQITYKKNGQIINENGFYLNFKINTMDLLDFQINVRKEGPNQIRVEMKQGFHNIYFFFEIIYEFDQLFSDGVTIPTTDQMIEEKAAYLIKLFKPFLQFFFREILFFENQVDYNIIYNSENYEQFELSYEPLKKYQNIDAMSYELFCMIFVYDLLRFEIELLDQREFSSFDIMKLEESAPQFFYFTSEEQKKQKFISGYENLTLDSLIIDQKSEKTESQILGEIYEFLTKANANQLNKPLRLIFGIPKIKRKCYLEIYGVSEGFIPGALIRFYGQGFYNEHYIPFAAGYYLDYVFKQIIQEYIKDYHDMLHSFHFAQKVQMMLYSPSEVLDLLRIINQHKDFQLALCYKEYGQIDIYLKKDPLYQDAFSKDDGSIKECNQPIDPKTQQKVIEIANDFQYGQQVISVMVTEPILQHKRQKLQLGEGVFLKQTYRANNMISQYIFSLQNMKYHKVLATKKLRSILYRFVNRRFEKLDENIEKDLHGFYGMDIDRKK